MVSDFDIAWMVLFININYTARSLVVPHKGWQLSDPLHLLVAEFLGVIQSLLFGAAQHTEGLGVEVLDQGQLSRAQQSQMQHSKYAIHLNHICQNLLCKAVLVLYKVLKQYSPEGP